MTNLLCTICLHELVEWEVRPIGEDMNLVVQALHLECHSHGTKEIDTFLQPLKYVARKMCIGPVFTIKTLRQLPIYGIVLHRLVLFLRNLIPPLGNLEPQLLVLVSNLIELAQLILALILLRYQELFELDDLFRGDLHLFA